MTAAHMSRRSVISAAAGVAVAGGLTSLGLSDSAAGAAAAGGAAAHRRLRPISMAMHIHGPFSEGIASFEAHLAQARKTDVDVVWWTDHDFRVAAHDHRQAVHFDGPSEPENTLKWTWAERPEGTLAAKTVEFVDATTPEDGPRALRLTATGGQPDGGIAWYAGTAWNFTYSTCLADTTLEVDIYPEQLGSDGFVLLQMELSYHPARAGLPAGQYVLRYRFGPIAERRYAADGLLGVVDIPAEPGDWRRFTLNLVEDIRLLWPDLVAEDNSLRNLRVGVAAPADTQVSARVDRLLFHRARRAGQEGDDLRREVLANYQDEYADVTHYRAYEMSLVRHLNWFGGDLTMPHFPSPPLRDNDVNLTASMVDFLHAHGGLVCWNHPMDIETRESLATLMIERKNLGADLVEIGRDPMPDLLWVLDVAARNAIFFTAVGASDDHGGQDWLSQEEPWITYTWSASTRMDDLLDALRAGRAWFTDPARYRGTLDISVFGFTALGGCSAMGSVLLTTAPVVPVAITATDLPADASLEVITGVVDRAGTADLKPATEVRVFKPALLTSGAYGLPVKPGNGAYVRTQVRAADGTVIAASNPMWLLRDEPSDDISKARLRKVD